MTAVVDGLPLHPLVVHVVVVLLPLSALGMIITTFVPRWRNSLQWVLLGGVVIGSVGALVASASGNSLAAAVGYPVEHAEWGNNLSLASAVFMMITGLWVFTWHLTGWSMLKLITNIVIVPASVAIMVLTYLAGHSGAEAVWRDQLDAARQPPVSAATITGPITLAEIAQHATPTDCWSAVSGEVYDLTDFIRRHPGGAEEVIGMCGRDATQSFVGEHGGNAEAEDWLSVFRIGTLAP